MTGQRDNGGAGASARPLRVLHLLAVMDRLRGGSAAAVLHVSASTRDGGDLPTILTTTGDEDDLSAVHALEGVDVVTRRRQWPNRLGVSWPLTAWLWRHARGFDLIEMHEVFAFPTVACWAAARWHGVPYVLHPHGSLEPYDMRKHAGLKRLLRPGIRRLLAGAAAVWLTADREAANLAHLRGRFRTVVTPLPVPPSGHAGRRETFRGGLGFDDSHRVVLFLGRLDPKKGLHRLIEAFETVADDVPGARLVVAGTGEAAFVDSVRRRAAAGRHAAAIRMVGFLSGQDKADAFSGADLFVLHSDNENFGIAPVEALRSGTPVLLSDEVYVADELAAAGAAVVVPATGEAGRAALAAELADLLTSPARLTALAAAADTATAPFLPDRVARRDASVRRDVLRSSASCPAAPRLPGRRPRRSRHP